jgi:hypothetical protein
MADLRRYELDDVLHRPGTYVNVQTEVVLVVDDTATVDAELIGGARGEGEWILVADEVPLDEHLRDELIEKLEARARRASAPVADDDLDVDDDEEEDDDVDELDEAGFSTTDPEDDDEF